MHRKRRATRWPQLVAAGLGALVVTANAIAAELSLVTGIDVSSGNYGAPEETRITFVPVTLKLEDPRYILRLTIPYLRVSAPAGGEIIAIGPDGQPIRAATGQRETNTGVGDLVAAATYNILITQAGAFFDLTGKIKLATADEAKGLGTGENDYSLQLDWAQAFDRLTPFASVGYRVYGDPPGFEFDNAFFASLGGTYSLTSETSGGAVFDFRENIVAGTDPVQDLTVFVTHKTGSGTKLQGYVLAGLSDSSPDWGLGTMLILAF